MERRENPFPKNKNITFSIKQMASTYIVDNSELSLLIIYLNNSYFLMNYIVVHIFWLLNMLYTFSVINPKPQNWDIYTKYIQEAGKTNNIFLKVIHTIQGPRAGYWVRL